MKNAYHSPSSSQIITEFIDERFRDPLQSESAHRDRRRKMANGHYSDSDDEDFENTDTGTPQPKKVCISLLIV